MTPVLSQILSSFISTKGNPQCPANITSACVSSKLAAFIDQSVDLNTNSEIFSIEPCSTLKRF